MQSSVLGTPQRAAHSSDPSIMHTVSGDRDEQVENVGCQLSTDQTVQVWTQIQQVMMSVVGSILSNRGVILDSIINTTLEGVALISLLYGAAQVNIYSAQTLFVTMTHNCYVFLTAAPPAPDADICAVTF